MAIGDSVIRVSIIGDVLKLQQSLKTADSQLGKFGLSLKGIAGGLIGLDVVHKSFDFLQGATEEADRLGHAMERLSVSLSPAFADTLAQTAGDFARIGASKQDILELEAQFAGAGRALKLTNPEILNAAEHTAAIAEAVALLKGQDPAEVLTQITNAAGGAKKAAKALGVSLLDTKDANLQLNNVLGQLAPLLGDATTGSEDLNQHQKELGARIETLQGQIGEKLNPVLADLLQFINDEIDAIPGAIAGFGLLGDKLVDDAKKMLDPFAKLRDILDNILTTIGVINRAPLTGAAGIRSGPAAGAGRGGAGSAPSDAATLAALQRELRRRGLADAQGKL